MEYNYKIKVLTFCLLLIISTYSYANDTVHGDLKLINEITKDLYPAFTNGTAAKQSFDSIKLESTEKNLLNLKVNYHHSKTSSNVFGTIISMTKEEWFYGYCDNLHLKAKKYKNIINDFSMVDLDTGDKLTIKMNDCISINEKNMPLRKSLNLFKSKIKYDQHKQ